jgi:asparagine synthase (glutamine-hydrolysing)
MCGIAGAVSFHHLASDEITLTDGKSVPLQEPLKRMLERIYHRGPDDQDHLVLREDTFSVGLASARLAIIDLSAAGHMPMRDEQTNSVITYNGEVYNYKLLRDELHLPEADWHSQTDTETLLKAYQHWGLDFIEKLRGMFAFALWDARNQELILARDEFGMKPLYYYANDKLFLFASELRALLASGLIPKELDGEGLASFLHFGAIESPRTLIKGIRSLAAGHFLKIKCGAAALEITEKPYVKSLSAITVSASITERKEAAATLRDKLEESVRLHLVSDVPLAAFLSGGIDSSAIVALMSRVTKDRPKTFAVVFAEKKFSEASFANLIAERFGTQHHEIPLSESDLLQMLPQALAAMDQPTIDGINTYVIAKAVKAAGITVALSGLGSDELFGGYPSFRRARKLQAVAMIPTALRKAVARTGETVMGGSVGQRKAWQMLAASGTPVEAYEISRTLFAQDELEALIGKEPAANYAASRKDLDNAAFDTFNAVSVCELQGYMANMLLRDTDQMSMAHSLEVRVPFVDKEIVNYVLSLKGEWKIDPQRPKPLLLDALGDLLPEEIWRRPKMGFALPFQQWMRSSLQKEIDAALQGNSRLRQLGIGDYGFAVWQNFKKDSQKERWARPWSLYVLSRWCQINGVCL